MKFDSNSPDKGKPAQKTSPKMVQFLKELQTLLDKYQYDLVGALKVTVSGIIPQPSVIERVPPVAEPSVVEAPKLDKPKKVTKKGK